MIRLRTAVACAPLHRGNLRYFNNNSSIIIFKFIIEVLISSHTLLLRVFVLTYILLLLVAESLLTSTPLLGGSVNIHLDTDCYWAWYLALYSYRSFSIVYDMSVLFCSLVHTPGHALENSLILKYNLVKWCRHCWRVKTFLLTYS